MSDGLPPAPAKERLAALLGLVALIEENDTETMGRVFEQTGRAVGASDVHYATSGEGLEGFTERLLLPDVIKAQGLGDEVVLPIVSDVLNGKLVGGRLSYALELLEVELDQDHLSDLIYWDPTRIVRARVSSPPPYCASRVR
jgi:hypothetical protein